MNLSEREFKNLLASGSVRVKETAKGSAPRQKRYSGKPRIVGVGLAREPRGVKATPHKPRRDYKAELVQQCGIVGLKLEPEFKFLADRQFRADWRVHYAIKGGFKGGIVHVPSSVLVEYDGGIFSSGKRGHSSVSGIRRDIEKSNLAQIAGYTIIRVAPDHVVSGRALDWILDALRTEKICVKCGLRQGMPPTDHDF